MTNIFLFKLKEERRTTGRMVAIVAALFLLCIAIYHAWIRKTAILAGVIVPALIIILYAAYIVFLAKREKRRFLVRVSLNIPVEQILAIHDKNFFY